MFCKRKILILYLAVITVNSTAVTIQKPRLFDWIFGPSCGVCPPRFCEDDPAVVLGYCCGCRPNIGFLPISCPPPPALLCPINGNQLCDDFEYMMACCC